MLCGHKLWWMLGVLVLVASPWAQQTTDYIITDFPIGVRNSSDTLTVQWTGNLRFPPLFGVPAPDSGYIYFDRNPGGSVLSNYRYSVRAVLVDQISRTGDVEKVPFDNRHFESFPPQRATRFIPAEQPNMGYGIYYCVVAFPLANDTLVSNEFQIIVQSPEPVEMNGPVGTVDELTPTFSWEPNPGVPYYHVILSDKEINFDDSAGLSIVWQAITPYTQITYGAPDPSGTITADPPPLSPGQRYTWIVLNNYANHLAFSSYVINKPLGFSVGGTPLAIPVNVYPSAAATYPAVVDTLNSIDNPVIKFEWSNLDTNANTYQVYVYVGADFEGLSAQLVVWEGEVMAGQFKGQQTASIEIDAAKVLTSNFYTWRVFAKDDRGAGTAGETTRFRYNSPQGTLQVATRERITAGSDTLITNVGLVEVRVEVLDGSMEAPLAFYTDLNGDLSRERPVGSYRITAVKSGFESQSKTVTVTENGLQTVTFFLERPEATIYGQITDESGQGVNLATVWAVSERGDSVSAFTDARGNYLLNTYGADWQVWAGKVGFLSTNQIELTVEPGGSLSAGVYTLVRNPLTLSGVVRNATGQPILGVAVSIYRDGVLLQQIPSTPQTGAYSFNLAAGDYRLEATKTGFSSFSRQITMTGSQQLSIEMSARAFLVKGFVYGATWLGANRAFAPITQARVSFIPVLGGDTISVSSHRQYGDFSISLPGDGRSYRVVSQASGFRTDSLEQPLTTRPDSTYHFADTLFGYAMVSGTVVRSSTGAGVGGVTVSLTDTTTGLSGKNARTSLDGLFEITGIVDGAFAIRAGKEGFMVDSVSNGGVLSVAEGRGDFESFTVHVSPGNRNIRWLVNDGKDKTASIKLTSPILKTLKAVDTLKNVGVGTYTVTIDAVDPAVLDLARHSFVVAVDDPNPYVDAVQLGVTHASPTSIVPNRDTISLTLESEYDLDSAKVFFRDATAQSFSSATIGSSGKRFVFSIRPPRDGSTMLYYFQAWAGSDVYGYEQELFSVFIEPDSRTLSKYEVLPSKDDTLLFAAGSLINFSFKGYYSSAYIPADSVLFDDAIQSWQLLNGQGSSFEKGDSTGLSVTVRTPRKKLTQPVLLVVTVNTNRIGIKAGLQPKDTIPFSVSESGLDSLVVHRLDGTGIIANAPQSRASFRASGFDTKGKSVAVSPVWSVDPPEAGTIDVQGLFAPKAGFIGRAQIRAAAGNVEAGYVTADGRAGLGIGFLLTTKNRPDTATNGRGCTIIFPDSIVTGGDIGLLTLEEASLTNLVSRGYRKVFVSGSAYDISETRNVKLRVASDSIELRMDVAGDALQTKISNNPSGFFVARWDTANYLWKPLHSEVESDGRWVSTRLGSFSRYALADSIGSLGGELGISPNPFSPYVKPAGAPRNGACIYFSADAQESNLQYAWIRIYNMMNDLVYSVKVSPIAKGAYTLWWDGRVTARTQQITGGELLAQDYSGIETGALCRNGRYYVILTVRDLAGKEKQFMKPVVVLK